MTDTVQSARCINEHYWVVKKEIKGKLCKSCNSERIVIWEDENYPGRDKVRYSYGCEKGCFSVGAGFTSKAGVLFSRGDFDSISEVYKAVKEQEKLKNSLSCFNGGNDNNFYKNFLFYKKSPDQFDFGIFGQN